MQFNHVSNKFVPISYKGGKRTSPNEEIVLHIQSAGAEDCTKALL